MFIRCNSFTSSESILYLPSRIHNLQVLLDFVFPAMMKNQKKLAALDQTDTARNFKILGVVSIVIALSFVS